MMEDNKPMDTSPSEELMLKFLQNHFPVQRIKDGRRFRRGIIIDGEYLSSSSQKMWLKPKEDTFALFTSLHRVLTDVFGCPNSEVNLVLYKYLGII